MQPMPRGGARMPESGSARSICPPLFWPALILINDELVREGELVGQMPREEPHESPRCNGSSGHNGEALFHG
jgi:hypothetical protein